MRHLKMMGVAAVAVFVIVAFAGATSASATWLCSTNVDPCPVAHRLGHTTIHMDLVSGTSEVISTSGGLVNPTLTCGSSTMRLTVTAGAANHNPLPGHLTALSDTSCSSVNPAGCENQGTVSGLATTGTIAATGGGNGTLRLTPPTVSFSCPILGANVTCTFGGSGTEDATLTGSATDPIIHIVNQAITATGGIGCPTASNWNARYTVTSPKPLFITTT